jgi:hypothetical protein
LTDFHEMCIFRSIIEGMRGMPLKIILLAGFEIIF